MSYEFVFSLFVSVLLPSWHSILSILVLCCVTRENLENSAERHSSFFFFSLNASLHFILFFFRLTLPLSFSLPQLSRIVGAVRHRRQRDHSVPPHQKCVILLACPCLLFPSSFTVVLLLLLLFYKQRFIYISPLDCNWTPRTTAASRILLHTYFGLPGLVCNFLPVQAPQLP